jgi:hypothetical protein
MIDSLRHCCVENCWITKTIFWWFELISGIKVKFFKSYLVWVNVRVNFMEGVANFLHCQARINIPFIYLEISVGANMKSATT